MFGKANRSGESRGSALGPAFLWCLVYFEILEGTGAVTRIKRGNNFLSRILLSKRSNLQNDSQRNGGCCASTCSISSVQITFIEHRFFVGLCHMRSLLSHCKRGVSYGWGFLICLSPYLGKFYFVDFVHFATKPLKSNKKVPNWPHTLHVSVAIL